MAVFQTFSEKELDQALSDPRVQQLLLSQRQKMSWRPIASFWAGVLLTILGMAIFS